MSQGKSVVFAEIEHLHNRVNVLLGLVDTLASVIHDDSTPEQQKMLTTQLRRSGAQLERCNLDFNVALMEGRGIRAVIREALGQPVDRVVYCETPATPGQIIDWNRMLVANGNNIINMHAHEDSPFAKALSPITLQQLSDVPYPETKSGIYVEQQGDKTAFVTILRIEREGELKHFVMIPYGANTVEYRTLVKDEGIWLTHTDSRIVKIEEVRDEIFNLLNQGFDVPPVPVDAKAAHTALMNALEDRKPGTYVKGIDLVYAESRLVALHHGTESYVLSLYIDDLDNQPSYRIELTGALVGWEELDPLMQQQLIRDFAVDLFSNEEDRMQSVEVRDPEVVNAEADAMAAANDDA